MRLKTKLASNHKTHSLRIMAKFARMWPTLLLTVLLIAALAGAPSCNTDTCSDNRSAIPLMGFYSSTEHTPMLLDSIAFGGVGAPGDSLLVSPGEGVTQVALPLRFDYTETTFRIHYDYTEQGLDDPRLDDFITFHYSSKPYFASEECGAYYMYTIRRIDYTRNLIDSIAILDSVITNADMERIQLFIRVADNNPDEP